MIDSQRHITFSFKQFDIDDSNCGMKVGTDGVILGAWTACADVRQAIDIGCGSGLIALMIAQRCNAEITAIDIDEGACRDARNNADLSPWADRIEVIGTSIDSYKPVISPDLIVSNPPFFASGEQSPSAYRALARHEGALNFCSLIDFAAEWLSADGRLSFIYPYGRDDEIIYKAEMSRLKLRRICNLRQNSQRPPVRTLYEFRRIDGPIETDLLTIKEVDRQAYTSRFAELCKDFYLEL